MPRWKIKPERGCRWVPRIEIIDEVGGLTEKCHFNRLEKRVKMGERLF